jgi:hypothetical protein
MKTIWKYLLKEDNDQSIDLPIGAKILSVQFQNDSLYLWAIVDDEADTERRVVAIIGTGQKCWCADWEYLGTVQIELKVQCDYLVWHIFIK